MTTARDITIYQGQAFALSLDYAGTAGRGQRMHIRLADSTATVVQILTHNGDANARVIFDTDALEITIGASASAGWVVLADRVEWVYDIEDYDLADEDDCVIPYRGKVIVRGNRTRASDVTPSEQMPSGDGRYVRFDGVQALSAGQQLQARENIGAGTGGGGGGSGDVVGPASATDDRIAAFDGVTGKLIKQGSVTATAVASHLGSTSNPHSVTAAQVGADATGTAAAAVVAHAGATDPHGDRAFATSAVSTHAAASDPHGDRAFATSAVSTHNAVTTAHGISAFGATLVDDADAATARTTLGLGTAATTAATDYATSGHTHSGVYQPADAELTAIAGLTSAADSAPYFTGSGTAALMTVTAAGRALLDDADASAQRATLSLGTAATAATGDFAAASHAHAASAITSGTLAHERGGLEADVSAYSGLVKITGGTTSAVTVTAAGEALLDDATAADQRTTLGLGTAATAATGDFAAASHTHAASDITSGTLDAARLPASTTSAAGAIEIATVAEVEAGTDTARAVTPQGYRTATPPYAEWGASTDKTLAITDANVDQWCNNGSTARVLNVPTNASVAFATGTKIPIVRLGSGTCTIDAATGVTLNGVSGGSCTISTQYQGALLTKTGTDAWIVSGDVSTVA